MVFELLVLNLFIAMAPVLIYLILGERFSCLKAPPAIGVLEGLASLLCFYVSSSPEGFLFNLGFVSLILSAVYGGTVASLINYSFILISQALFTSLQVDDFALVTLMFLGIWILSRPFHPYTARQRVHTAILLSLIPSIGLLIILIANMNPERVTLFSKTSLPGYSPYEYIPLCSLNLLATLFASILVEFKIKRTNTFHPSFRMDNRNMITGAVASIAHEIGNPLTAVKGFLQLIRETGDRHHYVIIALEELKKAENIISDYLNFSKPRLHKMETFSMVQCIQHVIGTLEPLAVCNSIKLHSFFSRGAFYIHTDYRQLQQALINIVKNAIEASREHSHVCICLSEKRKRAEIRIMDQGKGMTPQELKRIGTLFYTTKETGTGLGTTTAVQIIEAMSGKIKYRSKKGKGTVCIISLPLY